MLVCVLVGSITLLSNYMMVSFQRKKLRLKNFDILQPFVEKFKVHILNIPHNFHILEF